MCLGSLGEECAAYWFRYLEDATDVCALELDVKEIALSLQSTPAKDWDPATAGSGLMASQVSFFGIFDG